LSEFALAGKHFKNLRNDLRRLEKAGVAWEEFGPEYPPDADTVREMSALCASWRQVHRAREAGFAMGAFDPHSLLFEESRYFVARDPQSGRLLAFASFVPAFGAGGTGGWTLDLMRRRADALHGVMDFLIVSAAQRFAGEGAALLSLGLSPLAGAEEMSESRQTAMVRRFLYRRMGRVYNFAGLHMFKAKFATHWEPRYLVSRPGLGLAAVAGAVLQAHLTPGSAGESVRSHGLSRPVRRQGLVAAALLLLLLTPFEKTLAKRAVSQPRRWAHFHPLHFHPHLRHFQPGGRTLGQRFLPDGPVA